MMCAEIDGTGYSSGLNDGLIGLGANNSEARIDNVAVQVLPPEFTLQLVITDFSTSEASDLFTGAVSGQWSLSGTQWQGTSDVSGPAASLSTNDPAYLSDGDNLAALPSELHDRADRLSVEQVGTLLQEALRRWEQANPQSAAQVAAGDVRVQVVDLPGNILGRAYDNHWIQLDVNAAGHGWFLDTTPADDAEFQAQAFGLAADSESLAVHKMDALTVLMHELGHLYGYQDELGSVSLMGAALPPGTRRLPTDEPDGSGLNEISGADANLSTIRSATLDHFFGEAFPFEPRTPAHSNQLPLRLCSRTKRKHSYIQMKR